MGKNESYGHKEMNILGLQKEIDLGGSFVCLKLGRHIQVVLEIMQVIADFTHLFQYSKK